MKKRLFSFIICAVFIFMCLPTSVRADLGPKPSVHVNFDNMGEKDCFATLISKEKSVGPWSAWDGTSDVLLEGMLNLEEELDYEIWKAFAEYQDVDGYYFLQQVWQISKTKEIEWGYYPPDNFKILLYYPETETFIVSDIYERYAFDTYYTVDMEGITISSIEYNEELSGDERVEAYKDRLKAEKSYDYFREIASLIARILITICIEMVIALCFGFRGKKPLLFLAGVNVITQVILNVLLNVINYHSGECAFVAYYILFEIIVFTIEAVLYCGFMKKLSKKTKKNWCYILYALIANVVSFGAGMIVAELIPVIL